MKSTLVLAVLILALGVASAADLASASSVYIMPMTGGIDQYLALRMTTGNVMRVVTDPKLADVVMTDRIGTGFEERWNELYPPVAAPKTDDKDKDKGKEEVFSVQHGASQPISRGRGAYFLIDRQTRNVIWSTYARPKSGEPDDVNRTADQIVKDLAKARKPKGAKE
ncbi:MAG TPA: hypothetical protein VN841_18910 [Bryobacteraceae bacterium]|nr:hypothetical protein [Bryobacteraceae bacterium]